MFKINRKIEYALIALKHMSKKQDGQLTTAKEICTNYHCPFDPTSRVLQIMTQKGILKAEQGARGGYKIVRELDDVMLSELTDIIAGPIQIVSCFSGDYSHCDIVASCNVIAPMLNLNQRLLDLFKTVSVQDLIDSKNPQEQTIKDSANGRTALPRCGTPQPSSAK